MIITVLFSILTLLFILFNPFKLSTVNRYKAYSIGLFCLIVLTMGILSNKYYDIPFKDIYSLEHTNITESDDYTYIEHGTKKYKCETSKVIKLSVDSDDYKGAEPFIEIDGGERVYTSGGFSTILYELYTLESPIEKHATIVTHVYIVK